MAVYFIDLESILHRLADRRVDFPTGILIWLQSEELINDPTGILWRGAGSLQGRDLVENVSVYSMRKKVSPSKVDRLVAKILLDSLIALRQTTQSLDPFD